jgi:hypothetical protein
MVERLLYTLDLMEDWIEELDPDPDLLGCIAEYEHGRGGCTMTEICQGLGEEYHQMAKDQDKIRWQQFMEGVVSYQMRQIQQQYHSHFGTKTSPDWWAKGLVLKLLKATHGQWLYCNVPIHDKKSGSLATAWKEAIQREIKEQMDVEAAGLLDEDHLMMEVNLNPES